mgnify:CR=1 FL=1
MKKTIKCLLNQFDTVFWDFDGVIKDSVEAKGAAFEQLFSGHDAEIVRKIKIHHLEFGGLSRFKKMPIYLSWSGLKANSANIKKYCEDFSLIVKQLVINSPWVPGVLEYLESHYKNKNFIIITATPKDEIVEILEELGISNYFKAVYGSPSSKLSLINDAVEKFQTKHESAIMVGDSRTDYEAAMNNNIFFALRKTEHNQAFQNSLNCFKFKDFINE